MGEDRYDVTVLGGGLVGSAMALALARHGMSVALVDRVAPEVHGDPDFDGRAYAVAPGSRNLLSALGLWDGLTGAVEPVRQITVGDACPGPVVPGLLHFDPAETGAEALGWIVEDRVLRRVLRESVSGAPGVEVIAPAEVISVRAETSHARIDLAGRSLCAALVVACDGRRSATARAAGINYLSWSYEQTGLVSAIEHDVAHDGTAHQAFFPGGPFAVLPLPGNRSSLVWSERAGRAREIAALPDAAYMQEISARIGGRLGALRLAGKRWAYPLGLQLAMSFAVPRLVVAGDAAHGVHPIAGQGMNMGLRDVAALTEVLVTGARVGLESGDANLLEDYQRWRRFDATAMSLGMDVLNRMFSSGAGPVQALRNLGLSAVSRLGDLRRGLAGEASGQSGDVPRLLLGRPI